MSAGITPADLAKFIHRVPVGATIPAGVEHAVGSSGTISLATVSRDYEMPFDALPRWTAEPVLTPEPTLTEQARAIAREGVPSSAFDRLARLVAELAERIEAQS